MNKIKKYNTIIFDLDGTLVDSVPLARKSFMKLLSVRGIKIKKFDIKRLYGSPTKKIINFMKKNYGLKGRTDELRTERRRYFFEMLKDRNLLFPNVEKTLNTLKKDHKLAIATGSSFGTMSQILPKRIMKLFNAIVTIDEVKKGKPNPEQLLLVCKKLKINPKECLMVGDSMFDQISAKKARMESIGVLTGHTSQANLLNAGAKFVLKSVNELNKVI